MAFVPVEDAARCEVRALLDEQEIMNTLWFLQPGGYTQATLNSLTTGLLTYWVNNMIPLLPSTYQLIEVYARGFKSQEDLESDASPNTPTFGTRVGPTLPNNVSLSISLRSGFTGRSNRGRNYWPAMVEGDVTNNEVSGGLVQSIQTVYQGMIGASIIALNWTWVVVSFQENGVPRTSGQALNVTSVVIVDSTVDSMKRRLPGRGR